jgi:hypothetical protein
MKILSKRARVDIDLAQPAGDGIRHLAQHALTTFAGGYDPTSITEDFIFGLGSGRGSKVLTLDDVGMDKARHEALVRCVNDPVYFISTYCQVQHPVKGYCQLDLQSRPYQEELVRQVEANQNLIIKHPRQAGITSAMLAYALWMACFQPCKSILLGAVSHNQAMDLRQRLDLMYARLPAWMKPATRYSNRHCLELDNGSVIRYQAISEHFGRGISFSLCYLDSFAHVKPEIQEYVYDCIVPTVVQGGKLLIASTPDETNTCFHSLWVNACEGVGPFVPFSVQFQELPQSSIINCSSLKSILGEVAFKREYLAEFVEPAHVEPQLLDKITGIVPSQRPKDFMWELPDPADRDLGITEARYR